MCEAVAFSRVSIRTYSMSLLEFAIAFVLIAVAARYVFNGRTTRRSKLTIIGLAVVSTFFGGYVLRQYWTAMRISQAELVANIPKQGVQPEFVSSDACRACHQQEYDSWHASYHRTMTRPATPENVIGNFDNQVLVSRGFEYRLTQEGDSFWIEGPLPEFDQQVRDRELLADEVPNPPIGKYRVVMTTGKHHWQTYWVSGFNGQQLMNFPFVFHPEQNRWLPREVMFLKPPGWVSNAIWNDGCIHCHSTAGKPGRIGLEKTFDPQVAELGISCEACHGPGAEHVALNRSPTRRFQYHLSGEADPSIVQPQRLSQRASAQVCGQCHGVAFPKNYPKWYVDGFSFRAGDELEDSRRVLIPNQVRDEPWVATMLEQIPNRIDWQFWPDGMARVTGREYPAMVESPCYQHGDMTCLSCHSMHHSNPEDQLAVGMDGNQACLQCHAKYAENISQHTHHPADSAGSLCYNCHMPHTSYGLLKASRSHQVSEPNLANDQQAGRPNACNLCHLDQTMQWTADYLSEWYEQPVTQLSEDESSIAAGALWILSGDAGQRALASWAMGWSPAREASGQLWMAPVLSVPLDDPYSAVRYIAGRSLQSLPGFGDLNYDFIASVEQRQEKQQRTLELWQQFQRPRLSEPQPRVLLQEDGQSDRATIGRLNKNRDDRVLDLSE